MITCNRVYDAMMQHCQQLCRVQAVQHRVPSLWHGRPLSSSWTMLQCITTVRQCIVWSCVSPRGCDRHQAVLSGMLNAANMNLEDGSSHVWGHRISIIRFAMFLLRNEFWLYRLCQSIIINQSEMNKRTGRVIRWKWAELASKLLKTSCFESTPVTDVVWPQAQ